MFDIVMPLYNKENFVGQAIKGVLAQSDTDWRMYVVDDGSTDGGPALVESFRDPRIRLLRQANAGPAAARNAGIAVGSAEWIALLDADDLWLPDHLAELRDLRRLFDDAVLIGTGYRSWNGDAPESGRRTEGARRLIRYFGEVALGGSPFFTSSAAFSRAAMTAVGPFRAISFGEDTELWARLALHGQVAASSKLTVLYRVDTGGLIDSHMGSRDDSADVDSLEKISPAAATVLQRLPTICDGRLRRELSRYVDHEVGVAVFRALRAGRPNEMRKLLGLFLDRPHGKARAAVALARLPWPWGRRLLFAIFRIKSGGRKMGRMVLP